MDFLLGRSIQRVFGQYRMRWVLSARRQPSGRILKWLGIALIPAINGFGLPDQSQTEKHVPTHGHIKREPYQPQDAKTYIARVRTVAEFLRQQYGFGFGDSRAKAKANVLTSLEIGEIGGGTFQEANPASSATPCMHEVDIEFDKNAPFGLDFLGHFESRSGAGQFSCDQSAQDLQTGRVIELRNAILILIAKLDIPGSGAIAKNGWANFEYMDKRDPCALDILLQGGYDWATNEQAGFIWRFRYKPSTLCAISAP